MKRDDIKEFIERLAGHKKSSRMLAEAEDEEATFGDDSEEDEKDAEPEAEDEESTKDSGDSDDSEEDVKVSQSDEVELGKSLDDSLEAMFIDIETDALKSAKIQEEGFSLRRVLFENSLDLEVFAAETARIIKNADVLLDIESIILSKARDYLAKKYDSDHEKEFLDILKNRHNIESHVQEEEDKLDSNELTAPIAVGATSGEGTPG